MTHPNQRHDPVGYAEIERAKLQAAIDEFRARTISDDVFMALLKCRGFYGARLAEEFRLQDALRHQFEQYRQGIAGQC